MSMTLTEFLLARIAEDEAESQECSSSPWIIGHDFEKVENDNGWVADGWATDVRLFVRYQPSRVLAECVAKRRIVEWAIRDFGEADTQDPDPTRRTFNAGAAFCAHNTLLALALPYADHPDCRDEWRAT